VNSEWRRSQGNDLRVFRYSSNSSNLLVLSKHLPYVKHHLLFEAA
jgi:hypothetical protein